MDFLGRIVGTTGIGHLSARRALGPRARRAKSGSRPAAGSGGSSSQYRRIRTAMRFPPACGVTDTRAVSRWTSIQP